MYRRRRSYARVYSRPLKTVKYSNETYTFPGTYVFPASNVATATQNVLIVAPAVNQGVRKVKNYTLNVTQSAIYDASNQLKGASSFLFLLVYVPEGTNPGQINFGARVGDQNAAASAYEPNQNVICSGVCDSSNGQLRLSSRLARNLNSGDRIMVLLRPLNRNFASENDKVDLTITVNYAIAYT